MFYTVYKTHNLANGRYYIGVHKTASPNDDYLGSGTLIQRAIKKYGKHMFSKEVLFIFDNKSEAFAKEVELLSSAAGDSCCYNLHDGGLGGFNHVNQFYKAQQKRASRLAHKAAREKRATDPEFAKQWDANGSAGIRKKLATDPEFLESRRIQAKLLQPKGVEAWRGQKHTKASRKKMSDAKKGDKHNCWGTKWMKSPDGKSLRVTPSEVDSYLALGWVFGRHFAPDAFQKRTNSPDQ